MPRTILTAVAVLAACAVASVAIAGQPPADPLRGARLLLQSSKMMSPARPRSRVAEDAQCSGQTKPIIACSCEATDSYGVCLQESCATVCEGQDG